MREESPLPIADGLPPGLYEQLITRGLEQRLAAVDPALISLGRLDPADAHEALARHLGELARRVLKAAGSGADTAALERQIRLANRIASMITAAAEEPEDDHDLLADTAALLEAIAAPASVPGPTTFPARPVVPLSATALLVNGRDQPRLGLEVQRELDSADRVDLLCAFVKWHGLRVVEDHLDAFMRRGGHMRVITTTYIGATERRALDRLAELGARVKVSYETRTTRLHAKAWLFHRNTGFSTGYVGSSNLSKSALLDGLEWNVRLSAVEQGHLFDTCAATFDEYWEDSSFELYDPSDPGEVARLDRALSDESGGSRDLPLEITTLEVTPYPFQREVLDELAAGRAVHGHHRNLVVMATGTGKTVVAGLDYRRLRQEGGLDSLLFVAHREEILTQSLATFRHILRDGSFGERLVAGDRPREWRHVFASVQGLARVDLARDLAADRFDVVIIDEFHHASELTPTYANVLRYLTPVELLGLTATPERADGLDVRVWFDGRTAVELRLWEALERGLLAPFQYFGVHDETNLEHLHWQRGVGYDALELTNVYTAHHARTSLILQALLDKVTDVRRMRAIGFCVSIEHAEFMARRFNEAGITAVAVTSRTPADERRAALQALRRRTVNIAFTVDLFNEGVDIPEVDTVLFLRPTESATVFLQQLGRGLRLADDKPCLTVLDFIGRQAAGFRFDLRYRALTGRSRRGVADDVTDGFPRLPAGCHIELDRVAAEIVLSNVRSSLRIDWKGLAGELRELGEVPLSAFLDEAGLEIEDVYRRHHGGWTGLRRMAFTHTTQAGPDDVSLSRAIGRLLHTDDLERLNFITDLVAELRPPLSASFDGRRGRLLAMLHHALWGWNSPLSDIDANLVRLWANPSRLQELAEVAAVLRARIRRVTRPVHPGGAVPLHVHARYSLAELLSGFGVANPASARGAGVRWVEPERADLLWFNLRKTERHFSPTTMYADRAISSWLFQWESQSTTSATSATGQRYQRHREEGSSVHLFFREEKGGDGDLGAPAYLYAGPASYVSHTGDRPMRIVWRLEYELPADAFEAARVAAG